MKFVICNDYGVDRTGLPIVITKEELARRYKIPLENTIDYIPKDYYWVRLYNRIDNQYQIARSVHEQIKNHWLPEERKRIKYSLESMNFIQRLKFLCTSKVTSDIISV